MPTKTKNIPEKETVIEKVEKEGAEKEVIKPDLKEVGVTLWKESYYFSEISQPTGIYYAFVSPEADGYRQCHGWIKCRDFLHDALRGHITGHEEHIYGFTYKPKVYPPLDLENMRIIVKRIASSSESNTSENFKQMMQTALSLIHAAEKHGNIAPPSTLGVTMENKDFYVFEGATDWMGSTFMISLYTFLIRLGYYKIAPKDESELEAKLDEILNKGRASDHDMGYLRATKPYIIKIIKNRGVLKYVKEGEKRLFDSRSIDTFHNYTGIVSLCNEVYGLEELNSLAKQIKA